MRSRKSTATLTLVLIGAAALSACGEKPDTATRDVYKTQADCKRDWGDDDKKCERVTSGSHAGYFYGPYYNSGRTATTTGTTLAPRSGSHAVSSTTVSRGGLGSSASSHSSSGS